MDLYLCTPIRIDPSKSYFIGKYKIIINTNSCLKSYQTINSKTFFFYYENNSLFC